MKFEYNGVVMELIEIPEYQRECVYSDDGADLLYVKHRISVVCTMAAGGWPAGLSVNSPGTFPKTAGDMGNGKGVGVMPPRGVDASGVVGKQVVPYPFPKQTPTEANKLSQLNPGFVTDQEVRMRLSIPRRKLKITAYSPNGNEYVWLEAPRPFPPNTSIGNSASAAFDGTATDAANGPIPLRLDIVNPAGEGTSMAVHFMVEACLVPVAPEEERLILSHRWTVRHTHDDDHYLTRVTSGTVVFNGGLMRLTQQNADWYRNQFFHPVPLGFVRKVPEVVASSDGLSINYTITDSDPHVCFDPGDSGATSMDIVESLNYFQPSALLGSMF